MVDLHSHILPGLDDGAQTLEESLAMLKLAAATGTTDLVATPHANSQFPYDSERVQQTFEDLSTQAGGLIRLHLGCDLHLHFDNLRDVLDNPAKYTINHHQYLMVELPDLIALRSTRRALQKLFECRIVPVITHPERNVSLQSQPSELKAWVADGCLLQITAQSLLGSFGAAAKHSAYRLLRARLVHFVASDAHDLKYRPPDLSVAHRYVTDRYGSDLAHTLFTANPAAALSGQQITAGPSAKFVDKVRDLLNASKQYVNKSKNSL